MEENNSVESAYGLKNLEVWKQAMGLVDLVYHQFIPALPVEEKWSMGSQLRRASQSVPAKIAEGYGRYYYQEGVRFCYIARGSLDELYTFLKIALRQGFINQAVHVIILKKMEDVRKMLNGYIRYLKTSKQGINEPGNWKNIREPDPSYDAEPDDLNWPDDLS